MLVVVMLERWKGQSETSFKWRWTIPFISLFICAADLAYFYSLSLDDAMISVVSMVRRGSVIVSFMMGAFLFHEKNLKSKAVELVLVLLGMLFLYLGTVCN
jgi:transporter family protein